ncbi:MAG: RIP metalloprotease RseP [Candidatus Didemnitutus sp.]|nr:RIP metalloprotease RseP [Candidatus Didemnitutus sp.]
MELFSSVLGTVWSIFLIVLFFGGSIFVHELGHFLAARRRGVKVERFSIGFGPKIFGWTGKDGVDYRVSWLPLGGYVALPQLADMAELEGGSTVDVKSLPPVSYSTKVIVFVAGAVFNLIFAFLLATVLWQIGRPAPESITTTKIGYVAATIKVDGQDVPSPAAKAGLRVGDVIRKVDGREVNDWLQFKSALVLSTSVSASGDRSAVLTVERDGATRDIPVQPVRAGEDRFRQIGVAAAYLPVIDAVEPGSSAAKLGFQAGDRFVALNGVRLHSFDQLYDHLAKNKTQPTEITLARTGGEARVTVPPFEDKKPNPFNGLQLTVPYQLLHDTPWHQFSDTVETTFRTFWSLISPRGDVSASNLSGPIGIGRGFWDAAQSDYPLRFATWFAILVNINLAIFNLLPIPVLDGGHILFATIGKLRGRPIPFNIIASTQSVFVVLLLGMMLYVTVFGDIRRMVRDYRAEAAAKEQVEQQKKAAEPAK